MKRLLLFLTLLATPAFAQPPAPGDVGELYDSRAQRWIYNYYNRVDRNFTAADTQDTWSITTQNPPLASGNDTTDGDGRTSFIMGGNLIGEDDVTCELQEAAFCSDILTTGFYVTPIDYNTFSFTPVASAVAFGLSFENTTVTSGPSTYTQQVAPGFHFVQPVEGSQIDGTGGSGTVTFLGHGDFEFQHGHLRN
jgi:hypothetical protein